MARKSEGDLTIDEKEVGISLVQKGDKRSLELETSQDSEENDVLTDHLAQSESSSSGIGNSSDEPALEALRQAYGDLTTKLHLPLLLEHLLSSKLLTEVEYETAKSKESSYDKNTEVLSAMRRRTQKEILQFCQLLFMCNQSNCGRILLAALSNHGVDVSSIAQPPPKPPVIRNSCPKYYLEMRDLQYRFITLVRKVKGLGGQVEDLKTICIALLNAVTSTKRNVQEDMNDLMKCSDGDYIVYLQLYWDHLDCDLLLQLIRQLQKPELMTDWERYKVEVKEACKVTLFEARKSLLQQRELPAHQISAAFQTDQTSHDLTIQKILDLRDFLKKMMGMEEADFEGFDNADVTLFYTVNRSHLPFLVRLFALHRRSLQEFSITVIFVPGEFIYNVTTDQEFAFPKLACVSQAEACYQMKHLKEEMLHQFQELKSLKLSEEEARIQQLQDQAFSLRLKLKEEEMLRKKTEEDRARLTAELLKIQTEKKELAIEKKELEAERKKLLAEKKYLVDEKNHLTVKNVELPEKLSSLQMIVASKKESVMSSQGRRKGSGCRGHFRITI